MAPRDVALEAADRVEAFLDGRARMGGLDPVEVAAVMVDGDATDDQGGALSRPLLTTDLRELVAVARLWDGQ